MEYFRKQFNQLTSAESSVHGTKRSSDAEERKTSPHEMYTILTKVQIGRLDFTIDVKNAPVRNC